MNPEEMERILSQLSDDDRAKMEEHLDILRQSARRTAMAAIMVRNFSHGIGQHILRKQKQEKAR